MRVATFLGLLFCVINLVSASTYLAVAPTIEPVAKQEIPKTQREIINDIISKNAVKYDVSASVLHAVISCESQYNPNAIGDGGNSYGLAQIYLKFHPSVSVSQATDPGFAINFLAYNIAIGKGNMWTCYRNL